MRKTLSTTCLKTINFSPLAAAIQVHTQHPLPGLQQQLLPTSVFLLKNENQVMLLPCLKLQWLPWLVKHCFPLGLHLPPLSSLLPHFSHTVPLYERQVPGCLLPLWAFLPTLSSACSDLALIFAHLSLLVIQISA